MLPDISIIELFVYGLITYSSILMLIISAVKTEIPTTRSLAILRSIYLIPGIITAGILASSGINIVTLTTANTITNLNTTEVWQEETTQQIILQNPVWITVHIMIMTVLIIFVITQLVSLLTKKE